MEYPQRSANQPNYTVAMIRHLRQRIASFPSAALIRAAIAALLLCNLAACGNKGPLVLPDKATAGATSLR
jgi:hypothetical protein